MHTANIYNAILRNSIIHVYSTEVNMGNGNLQILC